MNAIPIIPSPCSVFGLFISKVLCYIRQLVANLVISVIWCWTGEILWIYKRLFVENSCLLLLKTKIISAMTVNPHSTFLLHKTKTNS